MIAPMIVAAPVSVAVHVTGAANVIVAEAVDERACAPDDRRLERTSPALDRGLTTHDGRSPGHVVPRRHVASRIAYGLGCDHGLGPVRVHGHDHGAAHAHVRGDAA